MVKYDYPRANKDKTNGNQISYQVGIEDRYVHKRVVHMKNHSRYK